MYALILRSRVSVCLLLGVLVTACSDDDSNPNPCPDGCFINEVCHQAGAAHPDNPCAQCDPALADDAWSDNDGAVCDDGIGCNGADTCSAGACVEHSDPSCDDGVFCNGVETCEDPSGACLSPGDPCAANGDLCFEEESRCCVPDHELVCDGFSNVISLDSCGRPMAGGVVENCLSISTHGSCADGVCGCVAGYAGAQCERCLVVVHPTLGDDGNTGGTWGDAVQTVQHALTLADASVLDSTNNINDCEIWVAAGTYLPGTTATDTFQLRSGVHLYGGFLGTESARHERDWVSNETILSGDINQADNLYDNLHHVVTGANNATLDGFTITGGYSDVDFSIDQYGGGMLNINASPTVENCWFTWNYAKSGASIYNEGSSPNIINCDFTENRGNSSGSGAITNSTGSNPLVINAYIVDNYSYRGGGFSNYNSSPTIINAVIAHNECNWDCSMDNYNSSPLVINATIVMNIANYGVGGVANDGGSTHPVFINSILYGNVSMSSSEQFDNRNGSSELVTYSNVMGGHAGAGNIDANPLFVQEDPFHPAGLDFHLVAGSPGIDQGDATSLQPDSWDLDHDSDTAEPTPVDLAGDPRVVGSGVDMGAYEQ